jgi:hypothetical protein
MGLRRMALATPMVSTGDGVRIPAVPPNKGERYERTNDI